MQKSACIRWVYTLNNPQDHPCGSPPPYTYHVVGREVAPTTGTPHLQGYIELSRRTRMTALAKWMPSARFAVALGKPDEAANYIKDKPDADYDEDGVISVPPHVQGGDANRERYQTAWELAQAGDIEGIDPVLRIQHYSSLRRIQHDHMPSLAELPACSGVWLWGPPGTGKSTFARAQYPGCYLKGNNKWWDGYSGEKVVLLEDFDRDHAYLAPLMKTWLDKFDFTCEVKGGTIRIRPEVIVITSNFSIDDVFARSAGGDLNVTAIRRRCKVTHFEVGIFRSPVFDCPPSPSPSDASTVEHYPVAPASPMMICTEVLEPDAFKYQFRTPVLDTSIFDETVDDRRKQKMAKHSDGHSTGIVWPDAVPLQSLTAVRHQPFRMRIPLLEDALGSPPPRPNEELSFMDQILQYEREESAANFYYEGRVSSPDDVIFTPGFDDISPDPRSCDGLSVRTI